MPQEFTSHLANPSAKHLNTPVSRLVKKGAMQGTQGLRHITRINDNADVALRASLCDGSDVHFCVSERFERPSAYTDCPFHSTPHQRHNAQRLIHPNRRNPIEGNV